MTEMTGYAAPGKALRLFFAGNLRKLSAPRLFCVCKMRKQAMTVKSRIAV